MKCLQCFQGWKGEKFHLQIWLRWLICINLKASKIAATLDALKHVVGPTMAAIEAWNSFWGESTDFVCFGGEGPPIFSDTPLGNFDRDHPTHLNPEGPSCAAHDFTQSWAQSIKGGYARAYRLTPSSCIACTSLSWCIKWLNDLIRLEVLWTGLGQFWPMTTWQITSFHPGHQK
jgi:hypothetical protein